MSIELGEKDTEKENHPMMIAGMIIILLSGIGGYVYAAYYAITHFGSWTWAAGVAAFFGCIGLGIILICTTTVCILVYQKCKQKCTETKGQEEKGSKESLLST